MTTAIEIEQLRKSYGRRRGPRRDALAGLDLTVHPGQVHGLLGENGAGKTTALRIILGLVRADAGRVRLFGRPVPEELPVVVDRVGAVLESPRFPRYLTGRLALELLAGTTRAVPAGRVSAVLDRVGLTGREGDRVGGYSLGMRQRLALAAALLKQPRLLVLDEPTNGLDPGGVRDLRALIRQVAADGTTILLSSHDLDEVQRICDHVTIVAAGRRTATGPVGDLLAGTSEPAVLVRVADRDTTRAVLDAAGLGVTVDGERLRVTGVADPSRVAEILAAHHLYATEMVAARPDLESVYLAHTARREEPR